MSVISGIAGSEAQKSSANKAADASRWAAKYSADATTSMFNKLLGIQAPYNALGGTGLEQHYGADPTGGAGAYKTQLENMNALDLPSLNLKEFNYAFDPNDPTYQYRQKEMQKTIDQASAARGNYNSRPTINALAQGNMALTADESEKQFGRAQTTYDTNRANALSRYGADYSKASDQYNAGYGKLTDLYNMSSKLGGTAYNKILDAIKIGQGAAGTTGQGATATGQNLSSIYGQLGQSLANTEIAKGQAQSDLWGGVGSTNTLAALALAKKYKWI